MANPISTFIGRLAGRAPPRVSPMKTVGRSGTAVYGGFVDLKERNRKVVGAEKYVTASELLANVSIIAASMRFFTNLTGSVKWSVEPAEDMGEGKSSDQAKLAAEFVEDLLDDMETSWRRIVRRTAMYRFYGFGIQEWTAKRRDDGLIGLLDIEPRPQHTIERWEVDLSGTVLGVWQRSPQDGEDIWLPRSKTLYLVDDTMTDSPEGLGFMRQLVEPGERIQEYLRLEGMGYSRDLRGIPIGRAPISEINDLVEAGQLDEAEAKKLIQGMEKFLQLQAKAEDTGLLIDSGTYQGVVADGETVSAVPKWAMELLNASGSSHADLGKALERLAYDCARIIGTESLLLGSGATGSRALSEDKSRNLYLNVNGTLADMAEGCTRDVLNPVWALNGIDPTLKPRLKTEDVAFKDVEAVAAALRDMATAGATLAPDDPVIDDVRDMLGVSRQPELTPERLSFLMPDPAADDPAAAEEEPGKPKPKKEPPK